MEILLVVNSITRGIELLLMLCIYYLWDEHIIRGNKILLVDVQYYLRERNITRGNEILLERTKYYTRGQNINRGYHILLAGTKYYSREWNITRGMNYNSREIIITLGYIGSIFYGPSGPGPRFFIVRLKVIFNVEWLACKSDISEEVRSHRSNVI